MDVTSNISERIKSRRKAKGLTQVELSNLLGVSPMSVRRWEWGERAPNSEMMPKLAEVLNTSVEYLMGLDEPVISHVTKSLLDSERLVVPSPNMAYWGGVIDNARNVALRGNQDERIEVSQMLEKALRSVAVGTAV